jgi:hypothetical protein
MRLNEIRRLLLSWPRTSRRVRPRVERRCGVRLALEPLEDRTLPSGYTLTTLAAFSVSDGGGTYDGQPFAATATITGTNGIPGSSLEGVTPSLTYYTGGSAAGTPLAGAPTNAGVYTVVASFAGSADYTSASAQTSFTISRANPTIAVTPYSVTFDGQAHTATSTATGVNGEDLRAGLDLSSTTHTSAGSYSDTWTYTDSTGNYNNAGGTVSDSIQPATYTADHFVVQGYFDAVAGNDFIISEIIAEDASGYVIPDYAGTVSFSSTDPGSQLIAPYTFSAANHGFSDALILPRCWRTASTQYLFVTDGSGHGSMQVQVEPGPAVALGLSGPSFVTARTPATYYVSALDAWGNPSPSGPVYADFPDIESSDPLADIPTNYSLPATGDGTYPITVGFGTVGLQVLKLLSPQAVVEARTGLYVQVLPNHQTLSFGPLANHTYGDAPFPVSATASSGLPVSFSIVSGPATVSGNQITISGAGMVVVEASQAGDAGYNAAPVVEQSFTVNPAPLTVTADHQSKVYGAPLPPLTAGYSGFVNGAAAANLTTAPALSTTATAASPVGDYPITASEAVDPDYSISYVAGKLTVTPAMPIVSVADAGGAYNGRPFAATATVTSASGAAGSSLEGVTPTLTYYAGGSAAGTPLAGAPTAAGVYTVVASFAGSTDYTSASSSTTFTITDAPLTAGSLSVSGGIESMTSTTISATFSDADLNAPTSDFSGTINWGDGTAANPDITTFTASAVSGSGGNYTVSGSHQYAEEGNYDVTVVVSDAGGSTTTLSSSTNSAGPSPVMVAYAVAIQGRTTTPGKAVPVPGMTTTINVTAPGGQFVDLAATLNVGNVSGFGSETRAFAALAVDGNTDGPSAEAFLPGTASTGGLEASATLPFNAVFYLTPGVHTVSVLWASDGVVESQFGFLMVTRYNPYPALASVGDAPLTAGSVSASGGVADMTPTTLSATFTDANPNAPTSDFSGTINWGDGNTTPYTSSAVSGSGGSYTVAGMHPYAEPGNYNVTVVVNDDGGSTTTDTGTATLQAIATTVTLISDHPSGSVYGQNVTFTATVSAGSGTPTGAVQFQIDGSDCGSPVPLSGGVASLSTATLPAGSHGIVAVYTSNSGTFSGSDDSANPLGQAVALAPLTVTANDSAKVYGTANPAFTASYAGFVLGQGPADLSGTLNFNTSATTASHAGTYAVSPGGLTSSNYALAFVSGTLTVTPASLTITADNKTKVYGAALPTLNASYSGFVNGDSAASLTTPPTLSTTATASSHVGNYAITASGAVDPDYTISYNPGTLSITPATLTVTADNKTKAYGQADPALTASYSGFVNGDTAAVLSGSPSLTTTAAAGSPPNTYPISVAQGSLTDANYQFAFVNGTLTVTPAPLSATAINFPATTGAPFMGAVATFINPDPFGNISSYTAAIAWGDGGASAGVISDLGNGTYQVSGGHTYAHQGSDVVTVTISHNLGYTTTATVKGSATVVNLGTGVQQGQSVGIGFWQNKNGRALINSFNGGSTSTALSSWLAATLPDIYGANAGSHNLTGMTNAQVAAFYGTLFSEQGPKLDAQVLDTALDVYATTLSLGGTAAQAYGFDVTVDGLGASTCNVGTSGAAFGVANGTTLTVYAILQGADSLAVAGVLYNGDSTLRKEAMNVFSGLGGR